MFWTNPGIPHKGWTCLEIHDIGTASSACGMCGNEQVRFIHTMRHPDYDGVLEVGCICAEKMSDDYIMPKYRERQLRNKATKKDKWLDRKWRPNNKGSYLKAQGHTVVVFMSGPDKWGFVVDGIRAPNYYDSPEEAKLDSFEVFWAITASKRAPSLKSVAG